MIFPRLHVGLQVKYIIHRMAEILFAPEIMFRGLDRCVSEQELNLLKLTATAVAQLGTRPAEVVRRNVL